MDGTYVRVWKEVVVAYSKEMSGLSPGGKRRIILCEYIGSPNDGGNLNRISTSRLQV